MISHLPQHWRERLLHLLMAPARPETMRFLTAWQRAEGGSADNNPINTTYPMPWSSDYNDSHVKNYKTAVEGVAATASTIAREPYLLPLWKDLQNGSYTAEQLVERNRAALAHWGTDHDLLVRVLREL